MKEMFTACNLFVGWPQNVVPTHNIKALTENRYYLMGKMFSTSLVQGGQPPVCFSRAVADYLVFDEVKCSPCVQDISDYDIRKNLEKV